MNSVSGIEIYPLKRHSMFIRNFPFESFLDFSFQIHSNQNIVDFQFKWVFFGSLSLYHFSECFRKFNEILSLCIRFLDIDVTKLLLPKYKHKGKRYSSTRDSTLRLSQMTMAKQSKENDDKQWKRRKTVNQTSWNERDAKKLHGIVLHWHETWQKC